MNKIYNAMLKLSDNDPVSTWKSLKKSYGLNEDKVDLLMQNFVSILNEDDSIFNRIMIATLEKDNIQITWKTSEEGIGKKGGDFFKKTEFAIMGSDLPRKVNELFGYFIRALYR